MMMMMMIRWCDDGAAILENILVLSITNLLWSRWNKSLNTPNDNTRNFAAEISSDIVYSVIVQKQVKFFYINSLCFKQGYSKYWIMKSFLFNHQAYDKKSFRSSKISVRQKEGPTQATALSISVISEHTHIVRGNLTSILNYQSTWNDLIWKKKYKWFADEYKIQNTRSP